MKEINQKEFESLNGKVFVQFSANWCGPCKVLTKSVESIEKDYSDVTFVKVNIDNNRELAKQYRVRSIPYVLFFNNSEELNHFVGGKNPEELKNIIETTFTK